jgi:nucleoside 2-deoxyribosyltransferase
MKPRLYLAAPLFSQAERDFNLELATSLESTFEVFLPQRDGPSFMQLTQEFPVEHAREKVFSADIEAIDRSSTILVVLDGRSVDEGASFELGYAYARGKKCLGFQTDVRRLLPYGNNPMIDNALSEVFTSVGSLMEWMRRGGHNG